MVLHVNYKGDKLPVRFSYRAMKGFKKKHGIPFEQIEEKLKSGELDIEVYETIMYQCLLSGHQGEEKTLTLTEQDMEDVLDECLSEFIGLIPKFFPKPNQEGGIEKKPDQT